MESESINFNDKVQIPSPIHNSLGDHCELIQNIVDESGWTQEAIDMLFTSPSILFQYHRLLNTMRRFFDGDFMINLYLCYCPICGVVLKLKRFSRLDYLLQHVRINHGSHEDYLRILGSIEQTAHFSSNKDERKLPVMSIVLNRSYSIRLMPTKCLPRPGTHYLALWLNLILEKKLIDVEHLLYQEWDSMVDIVLQYPSPRGPRSTDVSSFTVRFYGSKSNKNKNSNLNFL